MGKNKHNRTKIQSEKDVIALHEKWIADELAKTAPDWRGIEKWHKDIARHERIKAKLEAKLPGKRK